MKINCLGQGESIDSANGADAPSESEGERDKNDWHFRGQLCHFLNLCSRNELRRIFPPVQFSWPLGPAILLPIPRTLPLLCATVVPWVFLQNCAYCNIGATDMLMHTHMHRHTHTHTQTRLGSPQGQRIIKYAVLSLCPLPRSGPTSQIPVLPRPVVLNPGYT